MTHHPAFDEFVETIAALRAPGGCPWDREQTHLSIAHNMIEEAYEAVDAIEADDMAHLREELGDVLLQVVLQSQIAHDAGEFTIDDVCKDINEKMIRRHPHVFGELKAESASDVTSIWDSVKLAERSGGIGPVPGGNSEKAPSAKSDTVPAVRSRPETDTMADPSSLPEDVSAGTRPTPTRHAPDHTSLLESVPTGFPALLQAQKISRKAVSAGFEWETVDEIWLQVFSEIDELKEAYAKAPKDPNGKATGSEEVELEMGDVLFTLVNVARKMGIDAESALRAGCRKFRSRWAFIEGAAWARGIEVEQLSIDEMEECWAQAKRYE